MMRSRLSQLALGAVVLTAGLAAAYSDQTPLAAPKEELETSQETFVVEVAPGDRRWVSEEGKWELKRGGLNFIDITAEAQQRVDPEIFARSVVQYPTSLKHIDVVKPLAEQLSTKNLRNHLTHFTSFHTRYYKSDYGVKSATWLHQQIQQIITDSGAAKYGSTVEKFEHSWGQPSLITTIPGRSNRTVVIGAHQDSINMFLPSLLAAPGADDDGSGTVTILEAMRVLLQSDDILRGDANNTVEFHWYSAEEGGLLGSQAVFSQYKQEARDVKAMLQQDMTGYIQGTLDASQPESVGIITDYVDEGLTEFIKKVVSSYCDIPFVLTKCGYACSDHASAGRYGYPSAFVIESDFEYSDKKIHTTDDKIDYLSFDHMLQHAKMTLAFAYELAYADF